MNHQLKKVSNKIMEGQLNIFDFLHLEIPKEEKYYSILNEGQKIYEVIKGDVIEWIVTNESWELEIGNRGYRLYNGLFYNVVQNKNLGNSFFVNRNEAEIKADTFLKTHDVILAKDIKILNTIAYKYVRNCDKRTMIAFYCELENGLYYIKEFMTYHHISDKKGFNKFLQQQEFKYNDVEEFIHTPRFKNMYKCNKSDWIYAECGYSNAVG